MKENKLTLLGTGTSTGIPQIGCLCKTCRSKNPKNKRLRSSAFIKTKNDKSFIIDTTPDLRTQILREKINHCDGVFITHEHADHIHGIDDLKPFSFEGKKALDIFTHKVCAEFLKDKFSYIFDTENYFKDKKILGSGVPQLKLNIIESRLNVKNNSFEFDLLPHGHSQSLSIHHDKMAYIIDCNEIPNSLVKKLFDKKLDLLILDCVRRKPHQTHLHLAKSIEYAHAINAKKTVLTHLTHDFDHDELTRELSSLKIDISPGHDGQVLEYE